jgi:hypothetical protein
MRGRCPRVQLSSRESLRQIFVSNGVRFVARRQRDAADTGLARKTRHVRVRQRFAENGIDVSVLR